MNPSQRRTRPQPSAVDKPAVDVPRDVRLTYWWRDVRHQSTGDPAWSIWMQAHAVPLPDRFYLCARFYDERLRLKPEEREALDVLLPTWAGSWRELVAVSKLL